MQHINSQSQKLETFPLKTYAGCVLGHNLEIYANKGHAALKPGLQEQGVRFVANYSQLVMGGTCHC